MSNIFKRSKGDMNYLFKDNSKLTPKGKRRKRRAKRAATGFIIVGIEIILFALFLFRIISLSILPDTYVIAIAAVILLISLYCFIAQMTRAHMIGKILAILMSGILLLGFIYSSQFAGALGQLAGNTIKTDIVQVIVRSDDKAQNIKDTISYTFGYNSIVNSDITDKAISDIEKNNKTTLSTQKYNDWKSMITALNDNKNIQVMLMTSAIHSTLSEEDMNFDDTIKVVGEIKIITKIDISASDKKVNEEPFIVFVSGNDEYGSVSSTGRSDVNTLAIIHPKTGQVLLISTPRDYYINIENANGDSGLDKLTHSGNAGIDYNIKALEDLYGIKVDYFIKVNFTGCVNVVDALGGITINSDVDFTNGNDAAPENYHFVIGPNECDGEKTLAFVRERQCFGNGDFQRGKNQSAAISAMITKATSPAILANYSSVLSAVSDMMLTNMSTSTITSLIKGQLKNSTSWNVQSYSVEGTPSFKDCTVYGLKNKSVVLPDYDTVDIAKELINKTYNGEIYDVDDFVSTK